MVDINAADIQFYVAHIVCKAVMSRKFVVSQ